MTALRLALAKAAVTGKYVAGFASVITKDGKPVTDTQNDVIEMEDGPWGAGLRTAAHDFISGARVAKVMHDGAQVGDIVESVIVDDDFAKALGVTDGRRGWWIKMRIDDERVRKQIRDGDLRAFSIGGTGKRTALAKMGPTASDVHVDTVSTKRPLRGGRVAFTLSRYRARRIRKDGTMIITQALQDLEEAIEKAKGLMPKGGSKRVWDAFDREARQNRKRLGAAAGWANARLDRARRYLARRVARVEARGPRF